MAIMITTTPTINLVAVAGAVNLMALREAWLFPKNNRS